MYKNKCVKCGVEFETKNPKRVICPNCLYPDRNPILTKPEAPATVSDAKVESSEKAPEERQQGFNKFNNQGPRKIFRPNYNNYNNNQGGGFRRPQQGGGFRRPYGGGSGGGGPRRFNKRPSKPLLVTKEQVMEIEKLYKAKLPLPNHDIHEKIGEQIGLEPKKVFFGINLVRQKMNLPKLPFPKRKLAVSPEQLAAIKSLYEPLLPLPPIGCHKFIAMQLRMDEWRVHVGIGIIRKQMELPRWNSEREDAPEEFKTKK